MSRAKCPAERSPEQIIEALQPKAPLPAYVMEVSGYRSGLQLGTIDHLCLRPDPDVSSSLSYLFQYRPHWDYECLQKAYGPGRDKNKRHWSGRPEDLPPDELMDLLSSAPDCWDLPPLDISGLELSTPGLTLAPDLGVSFGSAP